MLLFVVLSDILKVIFPVPFSTVTMFYYDMKFYISLISVTQRNPFSNVFMF
jgi:hypothetical protein